MHARPSRRARCCYDWELARIATMRLHQLLLLDAQRRRHGAAGHDEPSPSRRPPLVNVPIGAVRFAFGPAPRAAITLADVADELLARSTRR